jgi:glycine/D-amino acid oxidase-like deaminating enzyme/nitrite reductase/ring-hydroxylating ferredoxin subunit
MRDRTIPNDSGHTISPWMELAVPDFDGAELPEHVDVLVVGAGIAGIGVAHVLAQQGVHVHVVDHGPIGGGQTARTTAHLASAVDDRYYRLEDRYGADGARLAADSHAAAIDLIEANVRELAIDCGFRRVDGYLFAPAPGGLDVLEKELQAARRAGLDAHSVPGAPLPFDTGPCLRFANQAQFHPIAYLRGLASDLVARGGRIHTGIHVAGLSPGTPVTAHLAGDRTIKANVVIDATCMTISSMFKLPVRQAAYRTYCLAFDVPAGAIPHALYWDTLDPYHYLRVAEAAGGRELLIVGGEDHRTGQEHDPTARWMALEQWTRARFPDAGAIAARWSGQVMEPVGDLGLIGRSPDLDHVFVVTGDSGNGLTHGTIAALLLPDLIRGREHPWMRLYDPRRSTLRAFGAFLREAAGSTLPYAKWLERGKSLDDLGTGEGAVIRRGVHLYAAYRDETGTCHVRNARCPHLNGVVEWNAAEQTWDCPCHGSRFEATGRVLNGPAVTDLEPAEATEKKKKDEVA